MLPYDQLFKKCHKFNQDISSLMYPKLKICISMLLLFDFLILKAI